MKNSSAVDTWGGGVGEGMQCPPLVARTKMLFTDARAWPLNIWQIVCPWTSMAGKSF